MFINKIKRIKPLKDHVLVRDMNFSERKTSAGVILPSDDQKSTGIRPRWSKVYAVGPEQKDVVPGQWICVTHGRWTRGIQVEINNETFTIRRVDNDDILLVSDEEPQDDTIGNQNSGTLGTVRS